MAGCLSCCKLLCCCFIVISNICVLILGLVLALLGFLFTWGFSMLSGVLKTPLESATSSLTTMFKTQLGLDIDIFGLLEQITVYTGTMGIMFLILGVLFIVISIVGCCGACCTVKPCLIIYAVAVAILFLAQLSLVIVWFANASLLKDNVKIAMETSVKEFTGFNSTSIYSLVQNMVQIFVGCCGVTNGTDFYTMAPKWNRQFTVKVYNMSVITNLTYPITCCKFNLTNFSPIDQYCPINNTTPDTSNYQKGCYTEIFNFIEKYFQLNTLFYALAGILGYQALLFLGSVLIIYADRKNNKVKPR